MDKRTLKAFLKAGYVYEGELYPTEQGTPQGGIISPILANHTLNGMEDRITNAFRRESTGTKRERPKIHVIRYADDIVITAKSKEYAEQAKAIAEKHVSERGLKLSEEKTVITNIADGFDFLGWNFRKYKGQMLIKPSKKSQEKVMEKIRQVIHEGRAITQDELIHRLNRIISGWTNYHQPVVAKRIFSSLDNKIFWLLWKWARRRHPNKNRHWIKDRYWKTEGRNNWVFKDTVKLRRMAETPIVRHTPLKLERNPYLDKDYFMRRKIHLKLNKAEAWMKTKLTTTETGKHSEDACLHEA
jgi:RNA-directed DNA polymerase